MFNLMFLTFYLVAFPCIAAGPAEDGCKQVVVTIGGDDEPMLLQSRQGAVVLIGDEDDQKSGKKIILRSGDASVKPTIIWQSADEPARAWIGVTVTPVPEPLAAHLERGGLMIANVVKDSPADQAGIQPYDVVISFGGQAVEEMDDLLGAIRETGAGNTAEVVIIRGGKKKSLTVTPVKRGEMGEWSYKYEQAEPEVDVLKDYFGHRFKIGPKGFGFVWPQGRMELPDDVKNWLEEMPDFDWKELQEDSPRVWSFPFDFDIEVGEPKAWKFWMGEKEDADVEVEIRIKISEDGETVIIERDRDGTISVERENAEGKRSSAVYENEDELQEDDPEAYATYRRYGSVHRPQMFYVSPDLKDLGPRQRQFQIELRHQLKKAREQVDEAMEQVREARKQIQLRLRSAGEEGDDEDVDVETQSAAVMIFIDDEGHITVEIEEDGVSKKYEFNSREEFQQIEPKLYKRFKKHLDAAR